jgi:hypothetical protein
MTGSLYFARTPPADFLPEVRITFPVGRTPPNLLHEKRFSHGRMCTGRTDIEQPGVRTAREKILPCFQRHVPHHPLALFSGLDTQERRNDFRCVHAFEFGLTL